jgi:hypothetical protein
MPTEAEIEEAKARGQEGKKEEGQGEGNGKVQYLTQDQFNAALAKERRSWEAKIEKDREPLTKEIEELRGVKDEFTEFKKIIEEAAAESEEDERGKKKGSGYDPLDEFEQEFQIPANVRDKETYIRLKKQLYVQGKTLTDLQNQVKEQASTVTSLRQQAEQEKQGREIAERARISAFKDAELSKALTSNRCIDVESGIILLRDRIQWDERAGKFMYVTKEGEKTSISEGVREELPNYMVQAAAQEGGSGSSGQRTFSDGEMQKLEANLAEAEKVARQNANNPRAIQEYQRVKRQVAEAKEKKEKNKGT